MEYIFKGETVFLIGYAVSTQSIELFLGARMRNRNGAFSRFVWSPAAQTGVGVVRSTVCSGSGDSGSGDFDSGDVSSGDVGSAPAGQALLDIQIQGYDPESSAQAADSATLTTLAPTKCADGPVSITHSPRLSVGEICACGGVLDAILESTLVCDLL